MESQQKQEVGALCTIKDGVQKEVQTGNQRTAENTAPVKNGMYKNITVMSADMNLTILTQGKTVTSTNTAM